MQGADAVAAAAYYTSMLSSLQDNEDQPIGRAIDKAKAAAVTYANNVKLYQNERSENLCKVHTCGCYIRKLQSHLDTAMTGCTHPYGNSMMSFVHPMCGPACPAWSNTIVHGAATRSQPAVPMGMGHPQYLAHLEHQQLQQRQAQQESEAAAAHQQLKVMQQMQVQQVTQFKQLQERARQQQLLQQAYITASRPSAAAATSAAASATSAAANLPLRPRVLPVPTLAPRFEDDDDED